MEPEISDEELRRIFDSVSGNFTLFRRIPVATYRIQFNHLFRFSDGKSILSYLNALGISECYASPYFIAKKGSLHGYDILNHNQINPEVGTEKEYEEFVQELKKYGMGQILDIVPNHMSIIEKENSWWMDVLENGQSSLYAEFFDIDWKPIKEELQDKLLLPILGDQYGQVLENQQLNLRFEEGAFFVCYADKTFPVEPTSYDKILEFRIDDLEHAAGKDHPYFQEVLSVITAVTHLPPHTEKNRPKMLERRREKEIIKKRIWNLYNDSDQIRSFIDGNLRIFNGEKGNPQTFNLLDELLDRQVYRLSYWRVAAEEINYRRFFDISELAAIRMENPLVFHEAHQLTFKLIREGKVTGLRVDHPDGLYNPAEYFYRLQKNCFIQTCLQALEKEGGGGQEADPSLLEERIGRLYDEELFKNASSPLKTFFYIVGEKILMKGERMPVDWPVSGTVGYVFLSPVNGIFIASENAAAFDRIYDRFIGSKMEYRDLFYEKKKLIMLTTMSSEIHTLGHDLNRISERDRHTRDFTLNSLTSAIVETIACFPVYRTYVTSCGVIERDRRYIEQAISKAKRRNPALNVTLFDFLEKVLLLQYPENFVQTEKAEWLDFAMRFQQVCAPIMARGFEDTLFYVYNRFVSLNEVGGNPEQFGTTLDAFHGQNLERTKFWPYGLTATSTHDTKRSEDVRARLNVLSEIPEEWRRHLTTWSRINKGKKLAVDGEGVPDRNEEYLFYQTLVGVWPVQPMDENDYEIFRNRMKDYMVKAIREAKVNTSWISPNAPYEEALLKFIDAVLIRTHNPFLTDFEVFEKGISFYGMINSLSQTLLKTTSPGVPDFYQGTEIWDFSLVDPDNRRRVDFDIPKSVLEAMKKQNVLFGADRKGLLRKMMREWTDGSIKLYVTFKSLNYRKENSELFTDGAYIPLWGDGMLKDHVCAFARQREDKVVFIVVPRFLTRLNPQRDGNPFGNPMWAESWVVVPEEIPGKHFHNVLTDEKLEMTERNEKRALTLDRLFANFPVAMLETA